MKAINSALFSVKKNLFSLLFYLLKINQYLTIRITEGIRWDIFIIFCMKIINSTAQEDFRALEKMKTHNCPDQSRFRCYAFSTVPCSAKARRGNTDVRLQNSSVQHSSAIKGHFCILFTCHEIASL